MMSNGPKQSQSGLVRALKMLNAAVLILIALRSLGALKSLVTGLSGVRKAVAAMWPQPSAPSAPSAPTAPNDLRQLADSLSRDLREVARKCEEPRAHLNRGLSPFHSPGTLELSIAWNQLVQISEIVAGCDAQYARNLQSTDPSLPVVAAVPPASPKKRGALGRRSAGGNQASGFGQPATGTVPALTGKLARQLNRDLDEVFRKTARAAQDCARQLSTSTQVTPFGIVVVTAILHTLNQWLAEQVQRIQRQYRIGVRVQTPVK